MTSVRYIPAISTDAGAIPVSTEVATHPRAGDGFEVQDVFLQQLADLIEERTQTPTIANAINVQIGPGDVISNIPVVMDFGQHQVHEGESHGWEYYSAAVPTTRYLWSFHPYNRASVTRMRLTNCFSQCG